MPVLFLHGQLKLIKATSVDAAMTLRHLSDGETQCTHTALSNAVAAAAIKLQLLDGCGRNQPL